MRVPKIEPVKIAQVKKWAATKPRAIVREFLSAHDLPQTMRNKRAVALCLRAMGWWPKSGVSVYGPCRLWMPPDSAVKLNADGWQIS